MLTIGMLWLDATRDRPLHVKIKRAAKHYEEKFGRVPNVCYVHSNALPGEFSLDVPIQVLGAQEILPHHFWLGVSCDGERS